MRFFLDGIVGAGFKPALFETNGHTTRGRFETRPYETDTITAGGKRHGNIEIEN